MCYFYLYIYYFSMDLHCVYKALIVSVEVAINLSAWCVEMLISRYCLDLILRSDGYRSRSTISESSRTFIDKTDPFRLIASVQNFFALSHSHCSLWMYSRYVAVKTINLYRVKWVWINQMWIVVWSSIISCWYIFNMTDFNFLTGNDTIRLWQHFYI